MSGHWLRLTQYKKKYCSRDGLNSRKDTFGYSCLLLTGVLSCQSIFCPEKLRHFGSMLYIYSFQVWAPEIQTNKSLLKHGRD